MGSTITLIGRHYILSVGSYRRSKKGRQWRLRRLQPRITNIGTYIYTDALMSRTGYDVTDYYWLAVIEVQKTVENAESVLLELESPNFTGKSRPACLPYIGPDMS